MADYGVRDALAPAPAFRQTRAAHLDGLAGILVDGGLSPVSFLERNGIDPGVLRQPDCFIGCVPLMETIDNCARTLRAPLLGIDLALKQPQILGFLGSLCRTAPSLSTALECLRDYSPVMHSPECRITLEVGRTTSELRCGSWLEHPGQDQLVYGAILTILKLCNELTGARFRPDYVLLKSRLQADDIQQLERAYGCTVLVGQPHDVIGFPTHTLAMPISSGDRISHRLLREYADRVRTDQQRSFLARVQDYIRGFLTENCTLPRCATVLGISARKLQVQLDRHGVSFSELLAQQREDLARSYLAGDGAGLDEVALRLGYADQTSFGRAFRRWTGKSPGAFRAEQACADRAN
jgi:AraC-like DNA-binding protein